MICIVISLLIHFLFPIKTIPIPFFALLPAMMTIFYSTGDKWNIFRQEFLTLQQQLVLAIRTRKTRSQIRRVFHCIVINLLQNN